MKYLYFCIYLLLICSSTVYAQPSETADDIDQRRKAFIEDFISYYQEAYQKEKLSFIEQFFSNDALIITETKELLPSGEEIIPGTMKSRPYNTIIENRRQYIEKLRNYFDNHIKISIGISNKIIRKHPQYPEVYGVNFFQIWDDDGNSSIIENRMPGYIFMMVDFRDNEMEPVIHVRTWQPQANISKPSDKYTLSDFCIISTR